MSRPMRLEKVRQIINLAQQRASSAEGIALDEIAASFGVDRRTAERIRDLVREIWPNMEALSEGRNKLFRIVGGLDRLTISPTAEEFADLAAAARRLDDEGAEARAQHLESLDRKMRTSLRRRGRNRLAPDIDALLKAETLVVEPGPKIRLEPESLATFRHTILGGTTLRFTYVNSKGKRAPREVVPFGLVYARLAYLVASAMGHEQPVIWRLDRMLEVTATEIVGLPPKGFSLQDYGQQSVGIWREPPKDISLNFDAAVADEAASYAFHPHQRMERLADGALRVQFTAGGFTELAWHLFARGSSTIEAPQALNDCIDTCIKASLARRRPEQT